MGKNVTHFIIGLGKGGAETMLYQLLKYRVDPELTHRVITLGASRYYEQPIRDLGIELFELDLRRRPFMSLLRLPGLMKGSDTLCCWMYHANLLGYLAGRMAGIKKIVWTVHHSNLDPDKNSAITLRINKICAHISKNVSEIIYTGMRARKIHENVGYARARGHVINNGCDCCDYAPDSSAKASLCKELGIPTDRRIVLSVTKNTPIKDVPTFFQAYSKLRESVQDAVAVLCGQGIDETSENIAELCRQFSLTPGRDLHLIGMRHDVPRLMAACDLYVLHSAGEAFPVTLVQAMASGCLCVTTDVGDAKRILAQDECVVMPGNPDVLAEKMKDLMSLSGEQVAMLSVKNRERAQEQFEIRKVVCDYEAFFR